MDQPPQQKSHGEEQQLHQPLQQKSHGGKEQQQQEQQQGAHDGKEQQQQQKCQRGGVRASAAVGYLKEPVCVAQAVARHQWRGLLAHSQVRV